MLFRVTYLDPRTNDERTDEVAGVDRTAVAESFADMGLEVRTVEPAGNDLPIPPDHLELQDVGPVRVAAPPQRQDSSWMGCLAIIGLVFAAADFFMLGILSPIGDFFVLFLCGILLVVAQLRRS